MPLPQSNDNEFLSLLSAQREILKRLKKEKSMINEDDGPISIGQMGETKSAFTSSTKRGLFADVSDPLYLMNEPIIERRLSLTNGMRKNKRQKTHKNYFPMDASTSGSRSDRHTSLCGMLANALGFDLDSTTSRHPSGIDYRNTVQPKNNVFAKVPKEGFKRKKRLDQNIDLATLRGEFVNFVVAMDKSRKSQQDIHDWDRKMGLKRSHSKTMRLSMRSRDKLRKLINV